MADFVFIHGGFHGAWCWELLINELKMRGARGFACDLPGHAKDATPRRQVTRQAYLSAVSEFICSLSLDRFTLVGHSLAGIVLPDIASAFSTQVREVVYIAALVLKPGERAIDLIPENRRPSYYEIANSSEDYSLWIEFEQAKRLFLGDFEESEAREIYKQLTPQPFQVYLDPATSLSFSCPVRYIVCDRDQALPPESCVAWADKLDVHVQHIDSAHDVMLSQPGKLADLLLG